MFLRRYQYAAVGTEMAQQLLSPQRAMTASS